MQQMKLEDGSLSVVSDDDGHDSVYGGNNDDDEDDEFGVNANDGLQSEVLVGNYEIVPPSYAQGVWDLLLTRTTLSSKIFDKNM